MMGDSKSCIMETCLVLCFNVVLGHYCIVVENPGFGASLPGKLLILPDWSNYGDCKAHRPVPRT